MKKANLEPHHHIISIKKYHNGESLNGSKRKTLLVTCQLPNRNALNCPSISVHLTGQKVQQCITFLLTGFANILHLM